MTIRNIRFAQQSPTRIIHEQQTKCKFNEMGLKQQQKTAMQKKAVVKGEGGYFISVSVLCFIEVCQLTVCSGCKQSTRLQEETDETGRQSN
jgi:hypothetical protein